MKPALLVLLPFLWVGHAGAAAIARDTNVLPVRVLAVNYDPILANGKRLSREMRWHDPRPMTTNLLRYLRECSGGYARYELVDFIDVNAFPLKRDGFRYNEESFREMWKDRKKAHKPDSVSYAAIFRENDLARRVERDDLREIWIWGAPYFGMDEYAMKIPGDQVLYPPDNPWFYRPYDIPDCGRTVWVMGFNYEVGEDNALHSYGHRVEGILSLTVGRGIWTEEAGETNAWNRFTRHAKDSPEDTHVGNVHYPPNATKDYDYGRTNVVMSAADDWFNYPELTGLKKRVTNETWGKPHHLNFMKWWLDHLPKNAGIHEGYYNNWWRYVVDYDRAIRELPPPGARPHKPKKAMY
jgi:hypothetical protein